MSSDGSLGRKRRVQRGRRAAVLASLFAVVMALAVACDPAPGTGRIRLTGAVTGTDWDGTAGCYGPGHISGSDDYGSWEWTGEVDGHAVKLQIADFAVWYGARLQVDGTGYWAGSPFEDDGSRFTLTNGVGHYRATMTDSRLATTVDVIVTFTCPAG